MKSYKPYTMRTPEELRRIYNNILSQLERDRVAFVPERKEASRFLKNKNIRVFLEKKHFIVSNNSRETIINLNPKIEIIRTKRDRIKVKYRL